MNPRLDDLHLLIRQLRTELEWAMRTGIEPAPPPPPPDEVEPFVPAPARAVAEENLPPPPWQMQGELPPEAALKEAAVKPAPKRAAPVGRPWEAYTDEPGHLRQSATSGERRRPPSQDRIAASSERRRPPSQEQMPPQGRYGQPPPGWAPGGGWSPEPSGPSPASLPVLQEQLDGCVDLDQVRDVLGDCTRCKLCSLGRKKIVFGVGNPQADIMFVGEGPGGDEDRIGEPFVGRAGQLLTRIIENGMKVRRNDVYIANIVKCRPPRNRDPEPDEVAACEPFLKAQIRVIQPKVLVALGKYASQTLLQSRTPITRLRGRWGEYSGIPLMPTFHPAYLLRNPAEKRPVWEDIQEVMRRVGLPAPPKGGQP